ncbi:hypothetical protein EDD86DRAFT_254180 [Gorgonomyces haynaldii]|nr:hypothetical protein EDD86DRAFT_254180 [Gorgonomyces haynaldii]
MIISCCFFKDLRNSCSCACHAMKRVTSRIKDVILLMLALLQSAVYGIHVLSSEWASDFYCQGPPSAVTVLDVSDLDLGSPNPGEIWTNAYYITSPYYSCGTGISTEEFRLLKGCCVSSLDVQITAGMTSASSKLVSDISELYNAPVGMSGNRYCQITPISDGSVYSFVSVYLLADGTCSEGVFSCSASGVFKTYNGDCGVPNEVLQLSTTPQVFMNTSIGDFTAKIIVASDTHTVTDYTTYCPGYALIPTWKDPWEVFFMGMWVLDILLMFWYPITLIVKLIRNERVGYFYVMHSVAFVMLMIAAGIYIYQWIGFIVLTEQDLRNYIAFVQFDRVVNFVLIGWTMLVTANLVINKLLLIDGSFAMKVASNLFVVIFMTIFYIPDLFLYYQFYYRGPSTPALKFLGQWKNSTLKLAILARIIEILFNAVPPLLTCIKMARSYKDDFSSGLKKIFKLDRNLPLSLSLLGIGICARMVHAGIRLFGVRLLGNDRVFLAFTALYYFASVMTLVGVVKTSETMTAILKHKEKNPSAITVTMKSVHKTVDPPSVAHSDDTASVNKSVR